MRTRGRTRSTMLAGIAALAAASPLVLPACGARTGLDAPEIADADALQGTNNRSVHDLDCAEAGITYIYTIGLNNQIYSFYPATGEFTLIGTLECPAPEGASPFSMAVDHTGIAYVVFSNDDGLNNDGPGNGELFKVSTKTAECEPTTFVPDQHGFQTFGMGFAGNAGGTGETLYVAADTPSALGSIDVDTFVLQEIAPFPNAGTELTGTGDGRLFGFYAPDNSFAPSYIAEIDPKTAGVLSTVELPGVVQGDGWAFGFWGGDFYTFTAPGSTTVVTRYRPSDGSIVQVATAPVGVEIVGAGVSTCAPQ